MHYRLPPALGILVRSWPRALALATAVFLGSNPATAATISSYNVAVSATVQEAPARITLSWAQDAVVAVNSYEVSRKDPAAGSWTPLASLLGTTTSYVDTNVVAGRAYEYQVEKRTTAFTGFGYITAGIAVPPVDQRGRVVLVVDTTVAAGLAAELQTFTDDLVGDGWTVARRDVSRDDAPATVRAAIQAEYGADPANVKAAVLVGHVPVVRSGDLNVDGHGGRPLPADAFYGDMDGSWSDANGDGIYDNSTIPSEVELAVGRIDFADMPGASGPFPDELTLLQRYFHKDHGFRQAQLRYAARALVGDRFGDADGEAFSASAYGAFVATFGPDRTTFAGIEESSPAAERWISKLAATDYLWVFGAGAGSATSLSGLGLHEPYFDAWSTDLPAAKGVFYLIFGSWLVDWSQSDNFMRAALTAQDYGLAVAWSGRPHLYFHHMALGGTVGQSLRLSLNNTTLYQSQVNFFPRGIHVALMGDPTLRLHVVAPARDLRISDGSGAPTLSWSPSADPVAGYHIYRGASAGGPFARVTGAPVTGTSFTDGGAPLGDNFYMVRATRLETTGSGTYYNCSEGVLAKATVTVSVPPPAPPPPPPPPATDPAAGSGGVVLSTGGTDTPATSGPTSGSTPSTPTTTPTPTDPPVTSGGSTMPPPTTSPVAGTPAGSGGGGGGAPSLWFSAALLALLATRLRRGTAGSRRSP